MKSRFKKACVMAGLWFCPVLAGVFPSLAFSEPLGVLAPETLQSSCLGKTLEEAEKMYGKKYFPTSWSSNGKMWNFTGYSIILYFGGPGKVSNTFAICNSKPMTLTEASQYAVKHLPKGYSVVRSRSSNASQYIVFESDNPLNQDSAGGWTSNNGWYCLDFLNKVPKAEGKAQELLWADRKSDAGNALRRTEEQMTALRSRPRLGMTLEELKVLWGPGRPRDLKKYPCTLGGKNSRNDRDHAVFASIVSQCTAWQWMFPQQQNLSITAIMWNDKCVGLDLNRNGGFTVTEAIELAGEIVPGISFALPSARGVAVCTLYSRNLEQGYKLQNWGDKGYFELKSSLLVNRLKAQRPREQQAAARTLAAAIREFSEKIQKPLMGQTLGEVRKALGGPGRKNPEPWWNEPTWFWSYPDHDLVLVGSFRPEGERQLLHHLVVVDRGKDLNLKAALSVGYAATLPYAWPGLSAAQLKSWFNMRSRDKQQRFQLKWYRDARTGPSLHVIDVLAERVSQQREEKKKEESLESIKSLL